MSRTLYLDGKGQRQGHSERQAFRDSHHQHSHTDDDELDKLGKVRVFPRKSLPGISPHAELDDENEDCQRGNNGTCEMGVWKKNTE